jgi:hypothetical protein
MIGGEIPNISFETFYVSKEESNCPLIPDIVRIGKKLKDMGLLDDDSTATISLGYGKRILINGNVEDYGNISRNELIEVADFDSLKKILLVLGTNEPRLETSVHWMIHHARDDVNVIVQINNEDVIQKIGTKYPTTSRDYLPGTLDQIKNVLKLLRDNKKVVLHNQGLLIVSSNIKEIDEMISKIVEELK